MKYAIISLDFRRFPLETCFRTAAHNGFDGVEIWAGRPHAFPDDLDADAIERIRGYKRDYHLETPVFTPHVLGGNYRLTSLDTRERQEAIALFRRHIDAAAALGCHSLLTVADHPGYNADAMQVWHAFTDAIHTLCEYGKERDVRVMIEPLTPMESPVVTTSDDCVRLIRDVKSDNLYAMMDLTPVTVAHEPIGSYFEKLGDRLIHIHICNTDGCTDAHWRLENGILPMDNVFTVFRQHGYDGWVCAELYSEQYSDPELMTANTARVLSELRAEKAQPF